MIRSGCVDLHSSSDYVINQLFCSLICSLNYSFIWVGHSLRRNHDFSHYHLLIHQCINFHSVAVINLAVHCTPSVAVHPLSFLHSFILVLHYILSWFHCWVSYCTSIFQCFDLFWESAVESQHLFVQKGSCEATQNTGHWPLKVEGGWMWRGLCNQHPPGGWVRCWPVGHPPFMFNVTSGIVAYSGGLCCGCFTLW